MTAPLPILILAAGASSRMRGADKLLQPVGGRPMLAHATLQALATGAPVVVVLPPDRPARVTALGALPVRRIIAPDARDGMAASMRSGIAALPADAPGVMILPADMPGLTTADLRRISDCFADAPTRLVRGASADGRPGHPVVFPADLFAALMALDGDQGGKPVLDAHRDRMTLVTLPGTHATLDLDTPEDWAAFHASSPGRSVDGQ